MAEKNEAKEFAISRVFNAPRELVWAAWTQEKHLAKWFGPKGFPMTTAKLDLRPGGIFHYCMKTPDGQAMWGKWTFREIVAPERIVLVNSFSDEKGGITRHPMSATWPLEMLSTTTLKDLGGKTEMTLTWKPLGAAPEEIDTFNGSFENMKGGWKGTMEQLEDYLKTQTGGVQ